jgi:hypothetical protein
MRARFVVEAGASIRLKTGLPIHDGSAAVALRLQLFSSSALQLFKARQDAQRRTDVTDHATSCGVL